MDTYDYFSNEFQKNCTYILISVEVWPCRLSFIDLLTMAYSYRPTCAMVYCVQSEITQKLFCNQSINACSTAKLLQASWWQAGDCNPSHQELQPKLVTGNWGEEDKNKMEGALFLHSQSQ